MAGLLGGALSQPPATYTDITVSPDVLTARTDLDEASQALGKTLPAVVGTGRVDGVYFVGGVETVSTTTTTTTVTYAYSQQPLGFIGGINSSAQTTSTTQVETHVLAGYVLAYDYWETGYDLLRLEIDGDLVFDAELGFPATTYFRFYGGRHTTTDPILTQMIGANAGAYQNFVMIFIDGYLADSPPSISAVLSDATSDEVEQIPIAWMNGNVPSWDNELWTGAGPGIGFSLNVIVSCDFVHGSEGVCFGPYVEAYHSSDHANRFIESTRLWTPSAPSGPGYYITNGTVTIGPCTASGFAQDSGDMPLGDWLYCETDGLGSPTMTFVPGSTSVAVQLGSMDSLDGSPACRSTAVSGTVSCERTGGASSVAGASISFAGAALTEVGGLGRTFTVVAINGGSQPGNTANYSMVFVVVP